MNRLLLFLVMLPKGLWKALGADISQLRAILDAKLKVDDRKPFSMGPNKAVERKKKKKTKNTSLVTVLMSFFMGMIYIMPILITEKNAVVGLAMFYTIFVFFLTFMLITDFAKVIVDTKDKLILFPKPISDKTLMMSRILYISIYLFRFVIPMALPAWIVFGVIKGWVGALWFPFPLLFVVFIVLFVVNGLYILMLKLSKPGKFKETINYFQIGFSIVFFATYMIGSRMMDVDAIDTINIKAFDWARYFPTYWLAASWTWIDPNAKVLAGTKLLSILAVVFPVFSFWATFKWLAPSFSKQLVASENDNVSIVTEEQLTVVKQDKTKSFAYKIADKLNKNFISRAGFLMTWMMTSRSRTFKMRVYPTFAYVPVYFFYILLMSKKPFIEVWQALPDSKSYVMLLYMSSFVIMQAVGFVSMSDHYKAAWVYYSSPVEKPGKVIVGGFKAMWVKFFLPYMIVIGCFVVYMWGTMAIIDVVLATINITVFMLAITITGNRVLPFSMKEQVKDSAGKTVVRVVSTLLLIGVFGLVHYLLPSPNSSFSGDDSSGFLNSIMQLVPWMPWLVKMIFIILSSILLWLLFDSLKNTNWEQLKKAEEHM